MTSDTPLESISTRQFSLRSLLCTIVTISMVLAYVRLFDSGIRLALINLLAGTIVGALFGWFSGRLVETITWTLIGGTLALCCVLSADLLTTAQQIYWLSVGLCGGLFAGLIRPGNWAWRAWSVALMWPYFVWRSWADNGDWGTVVLDTVVTLPVLAGLAILAEVFASLQRRYHTPLDLWAAGLILGVIAGNYGAIIVWNLWYV